MAFKTKAEKVPRGNYTVESMCRKGHTSYRKQGDRNTYECPFCGHDVK